MKYLNSLTTGLIFSSVLLLSACSKSGSNPTPQNPTPTLAVTSLSVNSGPFNTSVIITGSGFDANKANDSVFFNGKAAVVEPGGLTTQIIANVPLAAGTGAVTVKVNGVTATGPVFTYQPALVVTTFAGNKFQPGYTDGTGARAKFAQLAGMAIDQNGNLYVADENNLVIRKITPQGVVSTFAGSGKQGRTDGTVKTCTFEYPTNVAVDQSGVVYVVDGELLRKITVDGNVTTVTPSLNLGDYTLGTSFRITGLVADNSGNLFITDGGSQFVGKIDANNVLTAIWGVSSNPAIPTLFSAPDDIVLDKNGNLFVTDGSVWKIALPHTVTKFATGFSYPQGLAFDSSGNLYVADSQNALIKKVTPDGTVTTFSGITGVGPADGVVDKASFIWPNGLCIDSAGHIFIADQSAIREISVQ